MKNVLLRSRALLITAGLLALPALAVVPLTAATACYGRDCDQAIYNSKPTDGNLVDPDTWESSSMDGDWLEFGGDTIWNLSIAKLGGRQPDWVIGYISAQQKLITDDGNGGTINRRFTIGGGNTFEISSVNKAAVTVHNLTCAQYYLRLVVHAPPVSAVTTDAGTDAAKTD